jgi:zinc transporter, ZIP family
MTVLGVFVASLVTALATGLGALPFLFWGHPSRTWLGLANGLAAGFMVGASIGLLREAWGFGALRTLSGLLAGALFIAIAARALDAEPGHHFAGFEGAAAKSMLLIVGVMTVHSFTEGVGVGVAFGGGDALGLVIALAIAIHNIPEGLAISLVLVPKGVSVLRAGAWSVFSSLPQPLMAVPAFLLAEWFEAFLPYGLGFAGGAMAWMAGRQLVPDALRTSRPGPVAAAVGCAAAAMIGLQLLLLV